MLDSVLVRLLIELALSEDLPQGDATSEACIPEGSISTATIISREPLVVCGIPLVPVIVGCARELFSMQVDEPVCLQKDGALVDTNTPLATLQGETKALLALERTTLNFLQRMSGVASQAREMVAVSEGLTVLDTRKTIPGWRMLDKYAVSVGGASNHRVHLGDMLLVKNNHIDCQEGASVEIKMRRALEKVRARTGDPLPLEIEVRTLEELGIALEFSPDVVMLDNMSDALIREAVALVRERRAADGTAKPKIEASGGITSERLKSLADCGVDCVSIGALTTKAPAKDISMRISHVEPAAGSSGVKAEKQS